MSGRVRKSSGKQPEAEVSRPIDLNALGVDAVVTRVEAEPDERAALARRFDVPAIHLLEGEVELARQPGMVIKATGWLRAKVRRVCVVTLEEFDQTVEDRFETYFTDAPEAIGGKDLDISLEEDEDPEPVSGGAIDCGELVAQQLSLAMDPFPRSPGAEAEGPHDRTEDSAGDNGSPFRALKDIVGRSG